MLHAIAVSMLFALAPAQTPKPAPTKAAPAETKAKQKHGAVVPRESKPAYVIAGGKASARILLDDEIVPGMDEAALTEMVILPGAVVPEHIHEGSAEILYIVSGHATMTMGKTKLDVKAGQAIYIPAGTKHSLTMTSKVEPLRAIQVYVPGGPQKRFRKGEAAKE